MAAPPPAPFLLLLLAVAAASLAGADDPYRYFTWTVTYGPISPLGTTQQVRSIPYIISIVSFFSSSPLPVPQLLHALHLSQFFPPFRSPNSARAS